MIYADYAFYVSSFMGSSIKEADFNHLALRASQFLDYYTLGKSRKNPCLENLKMACCAIAEKYQVMEKAQKVAAESLDGESVKSESVGSYSVSYQTAGEKVESANKTAENAKNELAATARQYLVGIGLLYRGGC